MDNQENFSSSILSDDFDFSYTCEDNTNQELDNDYKNNDKEYKREKGILDSHYISTIEGPVGPQGPMGHH